MNNSLNLHILTKALRHLSTITLILFFGIQGFTQIVNPGFESLSGFPNAYGQHHFVDGWSNAGSSSSTPDFYHIHGIGDVDLPNTLGSEVEPFEGNAVMGFIACGIESSNKREYISNQFDAPLNVGKDYLISFRVCNGNITDNSYMGFGVDHLGIALSTSLLAQSGDEPIIEPTVFEIDSVFFDRDWVQFSFIFTADQAYEHLTMGVFRMDNELEFISYEEGAQLTYYFVDDFFMTELPEDYDPTIADHSKGDSSNTNEDIVIDIPVEEEIEPFFIPNAFTPNNDGDNDIFIPISKFPGELNDYTFAVYSRWGEQLFHTTNMSEGWDGKFKGDVLDGDVYVWNITYNEFKGEQKFTRKFSGSVNLIR